MNGDVEPVVDSWTLCSPLGVVCGIHWGKPKEFNCVGMSGGDGTPLMRVSRLAALMAQEGDCAIWEDE